MFVGITATIVVTAAIQLGRRVRFLDVVVVFGTVDIQQISGLSDLLNVGNQLGSASVSDGRGGRGGGFGAFLGWTDGR